MTSLNKVGRPTDYTLELAEEICDAIACSSLGLKRLCQDNKHWPDKKTIMRWIIKIPEFGAQYARAKQYQVETMVDEIIMIADDTSQDFAMNNEGKLSVDHEHINRARLKIDTRKWLAAKLCPRLYGNKDDHVNLKFPKDLTTTDALLPMSAEIFRALANKEITPEQAKTLMSAIKDLTQSIVIGDFNMRLMELEKGELNNNLKVLKPTKQ